MALDASSLTTSLSTRLLALYNDMRKKAYTEQEFATEMATIISEEIINHFIVNAKVNVDDNAAVTAMQTAAPAVGSADGGTVLKSSYLTAISTYQSANMNLGFGTIE